MKSEEWQKISELLEAALDLEPVKRLEFCARIGAESPELQREVESLLALETDAELFLASPSVAFSTALFVDEDASDALLGQQIGAYRIEREIGFGGMGAVYLAEREGGDFRQRVAVKLLKRELNTADIRRRFRHERQILAALEHPNITRLLDVGTTRDGVPFFVMEYIEGTPVDEFCKDLSLDAILKLFRQICETVAFAHRSLVVHRDLKPSNILVTKDGEPKLLDFGISKLLTPEFQADSAHTVTNLGAMTPEYASPEQLRGENITTASDIYSLGVILYELLTNHRPFESKKHSAEEIIRAVYETNPEKPSVVITRESFEAGMQNSANPQTNSRGKIRNPKSLRGDLDNIILTALRREPERRYKSVEKFAEDIDRHLQGLPVAARPNTFSYRAEKFIRRNRFGVAAGLLIVLSLLGGITATVWQARRAEQQSVIAQEQRARAQNRFDEARKIANSFLFEIYPQIENLQGATEARETLVKRALEYLDSLAAESADDAGLQRELAAAYEKVADVQGSPSESNLGDTKGALESYQKAQMLRESLVSRNPADADLRQELAANYEKTGIALWWSDETGKTVENYEKALALRQALVAENPASSEYKKDLAGAEMDSGDVPAWNNESEKALAHFRQAQTILENLLAEKPGDEQLKVYLARCLIRVGSMQKDLKNFDAATATLEKAKTIFSPLAAANPNNYDFGRGLWEVRFAQCEVFLTKPDDRRAIEICSQLVGLAKTLVQKNPKDMLMKHDLVSSEIYAGDALLLAKKLREAVAEYQKAFAANAELAAQFPDSSEYKQNAAVLNLDIGKANMQFGQIGAALENQQKARRILEEIADIDKGNPIPRFDLALVYRQLGEIYAKQRNFAEGRAWLVRSLEILQSLAAKNSLAEIDKKLIPDLQNEIARIK